MRILLASSASYDPPRGGSTRGNLAWLSHLAASGHSCLVVCGLPVDAGQDEHQSSLAPNLSLVAVSDAHRRGALRGHIARFQPDWVLVSSEDLSHSLLEEAHLQAPGRVVYLAHTPQFYPFGPAAWNPSERATALVRACAGVVAIARFTAAYIQEHAGCAAAVIHPPIYGQPLFPLLAHWDRGAVAMINPCAVKGLPIFAGLARRFPHVPFAALPGWGTANEDRRSLEALPNFEWLEPCDRIEQMLARTRILLVPSLWVEGFGLIVVEAMLRGVPVLASGTGGLLESTLGVGQLLPVRPIERFETRFDSQHMPVPVVPPQDLAPWADALQGILENRERYETLSLASKESAARFVDSLDAGALEAWLAALHPAPAVAPPAAPRAAALSPARRALLLERLRKRV